MFGRGQRWSSPSPFGEGTLGQSLRILGSSVTMFFTSVSVRPPLAKAWLTLISVPRHSMTVTSASLAILYWGGPAGLSTTVRGMFLIPHSWANSFSFEAVESASSVNTTTKLLRFLFFAISASIDLTRLVKVPLVSRANMQTTGLAPYLQR